MKCRSLLKSVTTSVATANVGAKKNGDSDYKNRPDSENLWKETTSIRHSPRLQTENSSLLISWQFKKTMTFCYC